MMHMMHVQYFIIYGNKNGKNRENRSMHCEKGTWIGAMNSSDFNVIPWQHYDNYQNIITSHFHFSSMVIL